MYAGQRHRANVRTVSPQAITFQRPDGYGDGMHHRRRGPILALAAAAALTLAASCANEVAGTALPQSGTSHNEDRGPTASVPDAPYESDDERPEDKTFPQGGPVLCEPDVPYPIGLCFPSNEVSLHSAVTRLKKVGATCYRDGDIDDAGLEVSDTARCDGLVGSNRKFVRDVSVGINTYFDERGNPVEEISITPGIGERGSDGPEPTEGQALAHSVKAFGVVIDLLWSKTHPDWATEAKSTFEHMQPSCAAGRQIDEGKNPPTKLMSMGYEVVCMTPMPFNIEGTVAISQPLFLQPESAQAS